MQEKPTNKVNSSQMYFGRSLARPNPHPNTLNTPKCAKYGFWHAYVVKWDVPEKHSWQMLRQVLPHQVDLCHSLTRLCCIQERIRQLLFCESLRLVMQADDRLGKAILLLQRFPKSSENRPRNMDVILLADKLCGKVEPVSYIGTEGCQKLELWTARQRSWWQDQGSDPYKSSNVKTCVVLVMLFFGADVEWRISIKGEGVSPKTLTAILDSLLVILFKAVNGRKED